jgi:glycosyltransferase involved in cell wall biosynthesis
MHGLRVFLRQVWPRVVTQCRDAHLLLAGRGSERLDRPEQNVHGLGYVPDDTEFLSRGSVFVNPQLAGSGIKLKSLVAMAAAKTLVSTANGVRGIPGTSGIHFIACDTPDSMVRAMVAHFTDPEISAPMAEAGRRLIRDEYGESKLDAKAIPLLERFCSGQTLSRGDGTGM